MSFRKFVVESEQLHVDLHIVLSDIVQGAGELDLEPILYNVAVLSVVSAFLFLFVTV